MVNFISNYTPIQADPVGYKSPQISVRFSLPRGVSQLSTTEFKRVVLSTKAKLRQAVARMVVKQYRNSGLNVISGTLLREARTLFRVNIRIVSKRKIVIVIVWKPSASDAYFMVQLYGGKNHAQRQFLKMSRALGIQMKMLIEKAIVKAVR